MQPQTESNIKTQFYQKQRPEECNQLNGNYQVNQIQESQDAGSCKENSFVEKRKQTQKSNLTQSLQINQIPSRFLQAAGCQPEYSVVPMNVQCTSKDLDLNSVQITVTQRNEAQDHVSEQSASSDYQKMLNPVPSYANTFLKPYDQQQQAHSSLGQTLKAESQNQCPAFEHNILSQNKPICLTQEHQMKKIHPPCDVQSNALVTNQTIWEGDLTNYKQHQCSVENQPSYQKQVNQIDCHQDKIKRPAKKECTSMIIQQQGRDPSASEKNSTQSTQEFFSCKSTQSKNGHSSNNISSDKNDESTIQSRSESQNPFESDRSQEERSSSGSASHSHIKIDFQSKSSEKLTSQKQLIRRLGKLASPLVFEQDRQLLSDGKSFEKHTRVNNTFVFAFIVFLLVVILAIVLGSIVLTAYLIDSEPVDSSAI